MKPPLHAAACLRRLLARVFVVLGVAAIAAAAFAADNYPSRPVRLIVPYAAGGNADLVGRIVAEGLTARMGVQFIVDNRPGASSIIGTELAVKAAPDGYTILLVAGTFAVNATLVPKLPYDTLRDLVPISLVAQTPQVLVASPVVPVKSLKDLIALAKSRPGTLNYGSTGVGASANMAGALLNVMAGIHLVHVPYKGTAQILTDVMGGHLHLAIPSLTSSIVHIRSGKLSALGVTSSARSAQFPELPTLAEAGVPGYQAVIWNAIVAPRATPQAILDRLSRELAAAMRAPEAADRYRGLGAETIGSTPAEFGRFLRSEIEQYARVIRESGLKAELR
jgi:tripartite-type tricarboxylate transporter receptor subunit TctC